MCEFKMLFYLNRNSFAPYVTFFYWYLCYIIESFYWFDALFRYFKIWNMISFSLMGTTLYGNKLLQIWILHSASDRIDVT